MNKPRATSEDIGFFTLDWCFSIPTEKISDTIIVQQEKVKLFVYIHGRKIYTYCSKLEFNCQILVNPA